MREAFTSSSIFHDCYKLRCYFVITRCIELFHDGLFHMFKSLGLSAWVDMHQANLTYEGMMDGVRASDAFLLILTKTVLTRWFCQEASFRP